jgi:hypothetical protein
MQNQGSTYPRLILWISLFGIAMAFLESAVVVYLRTLYYPAGYNFPMPPIDFSVAITEIGRELATIIMLLAVAMLTGRNLIQRFGYFLYAFAVWDIFYYVFLRILIHWPVTLLDTDILFLIPVVWVSPVICPVITSILMIVLALFLIISNEKQIRKILDWKIWVLLISGSIVLLISFTFDYFKFILTDPNFYRYKQIWECNRKMIVIPDFIPGVFNWSIFIFGILIIIIALVIIGKKLYKYK